MRIRLGVSEDLASVLALDRATQSAPHWTEGVYTEALRQEKGRCLFVADGEGVEGFAVASVIAGEAELESLVVAPNSRRRGLGRELCQAAIAWARLAGARSVALEVRAGSDGAIALYESQHFRVTGRRIGYYAAPADDALIMKLDCAASD